MKILTRLTALCVLAVMVFSLISCGYTDDVGDRVENYLAEQFPDKTFDIIDYEKHNNTSGRYEINIRCRDDGVKFRMFVYSTIAVTDGYSVERANSMMKDAVEQELGESLAAKFADIIWYDIYADYAGNYRFREVELYDEVTLADLDKIHKVELEHSIAEADVGAVIYDFVYELCDEADDDCSLDSIVFEYKLGRATYTFTTDSASILNLGKDGVIHFVLTNLADSGVKRDIELEYFSVVPDEDAGSNENSGNENIDNNN